MFETLAIITQLECWAPHVLQQGAEASPDDLREVIRLRALLDRLVPQDLERDEAATFFAMLRADRACAPHCPTLLYLPDEDASSVVQAEGLDLNPMSWYGVHRWGMSDPLERWAAQLGDDFHPAVVLRGFLQLRQQFGRHWHNNAFITEDGHFRTSLSPQTLGQLRLATV